MQYDHVPKKMNFDLLRGAGGGGGGVGGCGQNICYHVAALAIPFSLICNMFFFNFNLLTPWVGGGRGSSGIFFATMLLHPRFPLI